jgi:DNA-binding MarR family transcriptional regulator
MIEDKFTASLLALGGWLSRNGSRLMAPLGLSQQESVILITIAERGPIPQKDLRSDLLLERSNVSKAIIHLESKGLLSAEPHPTDARVVIVEATDEGIELAERCQQVYQEWNRAWLTGLDQGRLTESLALLDELRPKCISPGRRGTSVE